MSFRSPTTKNQIVTKLQNSNCEKKLENLNFKFFDYDKSQYKKIQMDLLVRTLRHLDNR